MTSDVHIGKMIFRIDPNFGTLDQRQALQEKLIVQSYMPEVRRAFSTMNDGDHNIPDNVINVRVGNTFGFPGTVSYDGDGAPGNYRVSVVIIEIDPAAIDGAEYHSLKKEANEGWHETTVPETLGNELFGVAGMINSNLDIDQGPGTGPNKVFGYPDGNGNEEYEWDNNASPLEKYSAEGQDKVHRWYGGEFPREREYDDTLPGNSTARLGTGLLGAAPGNRPIWPSAAEDAAALERAHLETAKPEGTDTDAKNVDLPEIDDAASKMDDADERSSPLVLDIDDDGIELTSISSTGSVYWAHRLNDFHQASGWITGGDGLLAIDLDQDGVINDSSELFGDATGFANGFIALAQYDSNEDGVIDAEDTVWDDLIVWIDSDVDAISRDDELHSLDSLLITQIGLSYTDVSVANADNIILQEGSFVINGNTQEIADVYFAISDLNSVFSGDYEVDYDALGQATHRGYGVLPVLHAAMSMDNSGSGNLLGLVSDLGSLTFSEVFDASSDVMDDVRAIMFRWAGVDGLSGTERGAFVDSRELAFMEAMTGVEFRQRGIHENPYGSQAGEDISEAFHQVLNHVYSRLILQGAGGAIFTGDIIYDFLTDQFSGIEGLDTAVLDELETEATGLANTAAREVFWSNVLRMIEFTVGVDNLSGGDQTALNDAIEASDSALDLDDLVDGLAYVRDIGVIENGTSGNDTKNGSSADDSFDGLGGDDTLYGNAGNDTLDGGADNDILDGGTGGDFLDGGNGNDTFIYDLGDGEDTIIEGGGTDEILMGAGIDAGDITLSRAGAEDLVIDIDTGSQTGRIIIENHFTTNGVVEQIEFSDTSTLALTTQNWTISGTSGNDYLYGVKAGGGTTDTIYGGAGHDVIYGYTGDDTLYGEDGNDAIYGHTGGGSSTTDTMYGGNGNDYIEGSSAIDIIHDGAGDDVAVGGSGNDEYHYTSGHDTYDDSNGTDEIFLPTGFSSAGTVYYKIGNTLQIVLDAGNSITIPDYYAGTQYQIETLDFFSDPDVDLTKVSTITQGGTGNDTLNGTSGNDTFYGNGGHDTLYGDDGNDTLYGGIGNDALYGQDDNDIVDGGAGDDYVAGGYGADTYVYVSGHDTYTEVTSGSSSDLILMGAAWTLADLKFERHQIALNSLLDAVITINGSNSITIKSMFSQSSNLIETIEFMDTSTISLSAQQFTTYGSSSNDVINGISVNGSTADIIYGNAGLDDIDGGNGDDIIYGGDDHDELYGGNNDDQLFGDDGNDYIAGENGNDTLRGGAGDDVLVGYDGNDLYIYDSGLDTITETLNDTDTLWIAGGRTINDMTIANYGTDEAKITITASVDEIIVYNLRGSSSQRVEYITFDDGFTTTLPDYGSWINGTSGNDVAAGNSSDNTIIGFAGNDTITGAGGSDKAHGGAGDDSLDGGDGADLLYGGEDDDILSGKAGLDTLHGGDGADTFVFETASAFSDIDVIRDFSVTDADVLDLTDILDTVYDPLNDAISDFVEFTESSGSTFVSVDRDGTGGTYSMAQIIKLENVTGLASPDTLETNGNLLAA